jgi:hypothetical protein
LGRGVGVGDRRLLPVSLGGCSDTENADAEALPRVVATEAGYHGHQGVRGWWETWSIFCPTLSSRPSQ